MKFISILRQNEAFLSFIERKGINQIHSQEPPATTRAVRRLLRWEEGVAETP